MKTTTLFLILLSITSINFAVSCTVDLSGVGAVFSDTNMASTDAYRYLTRDSTGDIYQKQTITTSVVGMPSCTVNGNSCIVDMSSVRAVIMPDNQATATVYEYVKGYAPDKILYATMSGTPTCQVSGNTCTTDSSGLSAVIMPDNTAYVNVPGDTFDNGNTIFDGSVISRTLTASISGIPTCTVSGNTCSVSTTSLTAVIQPANAQTVTLHFNRVNPKTISAKLIGQATCTVSGSQQTCSDGTPSGNCAITKPKVCVGGSTYYDNATKCGCPAGKRVAAGGVYCEFIPCTDGDVSVPEGMCSAKKQKKCVSGVLVNKASECGCPSSMTTVGESCISASTTPETQSNQTQEPSTTNCTVSLELVATTKMKLESMKLNFVKFGDVASSLANYYASIDKSKSASWRDIASDLDSAQLEIDSFIGTLKSYTLNDCSFKDNVNSNLKNLDAHVSSIYQKIIKV
ncbi:MAG: hypothetical protein NTX79_04930 [Candidatus Micrarchaeota archaeon]|nr:hypothetical protein [Candidatus Micrarchaeota archaeon]